ncbi:hypothetical protein BO71DRAFT_400443 [Aspergillus ellipticus CBS 707.79]|uniref:Uncharacterized protein n=1 Tax=Aspergillus ellipticus CBS 707.79 TaxID=1448320 RepID=A0A319D5G5_9EURO|nr:hypothetical protein BO71DRAFT_400443 [Aspergillus ellipticus CBS 707.79]
MIWSDQWEGASVYLCRFPTPYSVRFPLKVTGDGTQVVCFPYLKYPPKGPNSTN